MKKQTKDKNSSQEQYCKFPTISLDEEQALLTLIHEGDEQAREKFFSCNRPLVIRLAQNFSESRLSLQDRIAEGNIGLINAIDHYDPTKGTAFGSYATGWIKKAIQSAIQEKNTTIKTPKGTLRKARKLQQLTLHLKEELGREPLEEEISAATGFKKEEIFRLRQTALKFTSLNRPVNKGEITCMEDLIADHRYQNPGVSQEKSDLHIGLEKVISELKDLEKKVLALRYGLTGETPKTVEEVAAHMRLTEEEIEQIEAESIKKLQHLTIEEINSN